MVLRPCKNLCCICGGTKRESNTCKIRTRTHSHSLLVYGRKFTSQNGTKIHQAKMGCVSQTASQGQRSANTDKTSENQSQDAYHREEDIRADESKDEAQPVLPRMKFPPASDTEAWCMLDNIINKTLQKEVGNKDYNQRLNENSQVKQILDPECVTRFT